MPDYLDMLRQGGISAFLVLGLSILAWGFAFLALLPHIMKGSKQRLALLGLGSVVLICGLLALFIALGGWGYGTMRMEQVIPMTPPEQVDKLRAHGEAMALVPIKVWFSSLPPSLFGFLTAVRGFLMPKITSPTKDS